MGISGITIA